MAEIGLTPQRIASPPPPRPEERPQPSERAPQTNPAVDQLEISPEAEQRLSEVQANDNESVVSTRLSAEGEEDRGVPDFNRRQAISNFTSGGLFDPPPELFDERV